MRRGQRGEGEGCKRERCKGGGEKGGIQRGGMQRQSCKEEECKGKKRWTGRRVQRAEMEKGRDAKGKRTPGGGQLLPGFLWPRGGHWGAPRALGGEGVARRVLEVRGSQWSRMGCAQLRLGKKSLGN